MNKGILFTRGCWNFRIYYVYTETLLLGTLRLLESFFRLVCRLHDGLPWLNYTPSSLLSKIMKPKKEVSSEMNPHPLCVLLSRTSYGSISILALYHLCTSSSPNRDWSLSIPIGTTPQLSSIRNFPLSSEPLVNTHTLIP